MLGLLHRSTDSEQKGHEVREQVARFLYDTFTAEDGKLARLDRWTQRRISEENLAKIALVFEADDPVEHCYQDLIREIDSEAETGVFLARPSANAAQLRRLAGESGISGRLYQELPKVAPILFADELEHSKANLDIVWVTIEARYDRASVDAQVSEIIMANLLDDEDQALDMSDALRSLLYAFHEDLARRQSGLPLLLNERSTRDLVTMVTELAERSGDYDDRVRAICGRAGTA